MVDFAQMELIHTHVYVSQALMAKTAQILFQIPVRQSRVKMEGHVKGREKKEDSILVFALRISQDKTAQ